MGRIRTFLYWIIFLFGIVYGLEAQPLGMKLTNYKKSAQLPFELHNNLIVVSVRLNNTLPVKLILDTGAQYTIITKRELTDLLDAMYGKKVTLYGSDRSVELHAQLAHNIGLNLPNLVMKRQTLLVLDQDYLNLEYLLGTPIHGILGTDIFKRFVVKIDYFKKVITLYEREVFNDPGTDYSRHNIAIHHGKPYLTGNVKFNVESSFSPILLIDSGASLSLVLHPNTDEQVNVPDDFIKGNIGFGLGGELEGFLGRVFEFDLEPYDFKNLVTNFQDLPIIEDSLSVIYRRNGFFGGELLSRFTCIFDFHKNLLYLKPNKKFSKSFAQDKSGLDIYASGIDLNNFIVRQVIGNTPAYRAGILPGDEILKINAKFHSNMDLQDVTRVLQGKTGKQIRMVVRRNGVKRKVIFRLREFY
ncbi:MAG: PDZ domain-containing protein [Bacteroidota bacterium]